MYQLRAYSKARKTVLVRRLIEQPGESKQAEPHLHGGVGDPDIDPCGASRANIKMYGKLNADLLGASFFEYVGNVVPGKTSTSGASQIRQAS